MHLDQTFMLRLDGPATFRCKEPIDQAQGGFRDVDVIRLAFFLQPFRDIHTISPDIVCRAISPNLAGYQTTRMNTRAMPQFG